MLMYLPLWVTDICSKTEELILKYLFTGSTLTKIDLKSIAKN
jgi:hypothetical protein